MDSGSNDNIMGDLEARLIQVSVYVICLSYLFLFFVILAFVSGALYYRELLNFQPRSLEHQDSHQDGVCATV